jgi:hypothetical protein
MNAFRPKTEILDSSQIDVIIEKAMDILADSGIFIGSQMIVDSLRGHPGIEIVKEKIVK